MSTSNGVEARVQAPKIAQNLPRWVYNHWILYYSSNIFPLLHLIGLYFSDLYPKYATWWFLTIPIFVFLVLPVVDYITKDYFIPYAEYDGKKKEIPKPKRSVSRSRQLYKSALYTYVIFHLCTFLVSAYRIRTYKISNLHFWLQCLSAAMIATAPGMAVAHEFFHKNNKLEQFLGKLLLTLVGYTHFYIGKKKKKKKL